MVGPGQIRQIAVALIASNPGVTDDASKGYFVGSVVLSQASSQLYISTDVTVGAASWTLIPFGSGVTPAALTRVDDTNVTLTLGGTPATALLQAASITAGWSGQLSLARGGTNANLTAANGAIPYSTATAIALLAAGASGQILTSGGAGAPTWQYTDQYQFLPSNTANTVLDTVDGSQITIPANSSFLVEAMFKIGCSGTSGMGLGLNYTSLTIPAWSLEANTTGASVQSAVNGAPPATGAVSTTAYCAEISANRMAWYSFLVTNATGGALTVEWIFESKSGAQTSTFYQDGSWIRYRRIT